MTPEEQRIAIAKAVGWTEIKVHANGYMTGTRPRHEMEDEPQLLMGVPHYLNDLNAIHEAILSLTERRTRQIFEMTLLEVCRPEIYRDPDEDTFAHIEHLRTHPGAYIGWFEVEHGNAFPIINATAAQRCEAFLRTIGKWKD